MPSQGQQFQQQLMMNLIMRKLDEESRGKRSAADAAARQAKAVRDQEFALEKQERGKLLDF